FSPATNLRITVTNFGVGVSPTSATVTAGESASYQVSVAAQGGPFASAVTLACANLPVGATCSFNPPTVSPGGGSAPSTLTIATTARTGAQAAGRRASVVSTVRRTGSSVALLLLSIAVLSAPHAPKRRRLAVAVPAAWLGALIA